jgi:hypothetical protein
MLKARETSIRSNLLSGTQRSAWDRGRFVAFGSQARVTQAASHVARDEPAHCRRKETRVERRDAFVSLHIRPVFGIEGSAAPSGF